MCKSNKIICKTTYMSRFCIFRAKGISVRGAPTTYAIQRMTRRGIVQSFIWRF